jgi:hypothetical protein
MTAYSLPITQGQFTVTGRALSFIKGYALPAHTGISSIVLRMTSRNAISESPFTYAHQVISHQGQRWEADVNLPPMNNANARIWLAWFAKLDGSLNVFTLGDPVNSTPQGSAGGTPLVAGADQTGKYLNIDGCTASQTGWLKAGDYIQIGNGSEARLHMVTEDASSDGSGNVTLSLWPEIRSAYPDNSTVVTSSPVGAFRLVSNVSTWSVDQASIYGISFSAVGVV